MISRKIVVGCDLLLGLKLYRVPDAGLVDLGAAFPGLEVHKINTPDSAAEDLSEIEVYWGNRITAELIRNLTNLKWIHFGSVGVNRAAVPEVVERKIIVTNSRGTMDTAVAVTALGFMIILTRGFHHCWNLRSAGRLDRTHFDRYFDNIDELEGRTCLIAGYGEVGNRLARICSAIGVRVHAIKNDRSVVPPYVDRLYALSDLKDAVRDADFVVNLLPLTDATLRVFAAEVFANMQAHAFFINVGRGETVDEAELIEALKSGKIAGAGLDVFANEPLAPSSPLWNLTNVVITPHIAGLTNRYWQKELALFGENLKRYLSGEPLLNRVEMTRGY